MDYSQLTAFGYLMVIFLILPLFGGWVITTISNKTSSNFSNRFGINSSIYFGFLGIIIHELSHLVIALIFGHGVQKISLIKKPSNDGTLGYVTHTYQKKSYWQRFGNAVIGFAPFIGISLSVYLITYLLLPEIINGTFTFTYLLNNIWKTIIWIYLLINLSFGLSLSSADWANIKDGILFYLFLLVVVLGFLSLFISIVFIQALLLDSILVWLVLLIQTVAIYLIGRLITS